MKGKISFFIIVILIMSLVPADCRSAEAVRAPEKNKIIYLTFDDGPSSNVSPEILSVLREQQVKATFFVVGSMINGREQVLKRIHEEGHSIGLHTYSHKPELIYASEDAFIDEMVKTSLEVKKVIGIEPDIIRFPYGSNRHLSNTLLNKLHENKFKIYDWNVGTCDGIKPGEAPEFLVYQAIAKGSGIPYIVLLLHCNNSNINTCRALPGIIEYYRNMGYEFKTITNEIPEFYWHS